MKLPALALLLASLPLSCGGVEASPAGDASAPDAALVVRPGVVGEYTGHVAAFAMYRHAGASADLPSVSHSGFRFGVYPTPSTLTVYIFEAIPDCTLPFDQRTGAITPTRCTVPQWGPTTGGGVTGAVIALDAGTLTLTRAGSGWSLAGEVRGSVTGDDQGPISGTVILRINGARGVMP